MTVLVLMLFYFMALSGGCCKKMALTSKLKSINLSKNSIVLMTVKVANDHVPGHQPSLSMAVVKSNSKKSKTHSFETQKPFISENKQYNTHLISMALPPGKYEMDRCMGYRRVPFLLAASCILPVEASFSLKENEIVYIGHVEAHIRKKKGSEKAAGGPFPLIDQAIAGFSTGTFEVDIIDNYDIDMQYFRSKYPVLGNKIVIKEIMK